MVKRKLNKKNYLGGTNPSDNPTIQEKANSAPNNGKAMEPNLYNRALIYVFMSPYILITFFLLLSIVNMNMKGMMYVIGVIILMGVISTLQLFVSSDVIPKKCNFFGDLLNDIPCFSTALYSYTIIYLFMAMINSNIINIALLITLFCITALDIVIRSQTKCTNGIGVIIGLIIGGAIGVFWYMLMVEAGPKFLYFEEYVSNKVACSVPKKQDFKCRLFKDGQAIDSIDSGLGIVTGGQTMISGSNDHTHSI